MTSPMKKFFKTILSDRQLTVGCVLLLLLLFVAFAGPVLAPYDPYYPSWPPTTPTTMAATSSRSLARWPMPSVRTTWARTYGR